MTREEEIQKAAEEHGRSPIKGEYYYDNADSFEAGARWTDEHPAKKQSITIDAWVRGKDSAHYPYSKTVLVTCGQGSFFSISTNTISPLSPLRTPPKKVKVTIELEEEQ